MYEREIGNVAARHRAGLEVIFRAGSSGQCIITSHCFAAQGSRPACHVKQSFRAAHPVSCGQVEEIRESRGIPTLAPELAKRVCQHITESVLSFFPPLFALFSACPFSASILPV